MKAFERLIDGSGARRPSDTVHAKVLAANVAETITVPDDATHVVLNGTGNFFVQFFDSVDDLVANGGFAADTDWAKGEDWTIGSGVATASDATSTAISQEIDLVEGQSYLLSFKITRDAGGIIPKVGGTAGTERTAADTYSEVIVAGSDGELTFEGNGFTGTLDDVSLVPVAKVPGDNDTGGAAELVTEERAFIVSAGEKISVVSADTPIVTASFYRS